MRAGEMADKWIAGATAHAHGQFAAKAKKAGMSTAEYAAKVLRANSKADPTTKKQASLAQTLMGMHR
jgi:hypothetical protein